MVLFPLVVLVSGSTFYIELRLKSGLERMIKKLEICGKATGWSLKFDTFKVVDFGVDG
jgi:hypothetical protein